MRLDACVCWFLGAILWRYWNHCRRSPSTICFWSSCAGRLVCGRLCDFGMINTFFVYQTAEIVAGMSILFVTMTTSYAHMIVFILVFGLNLSLYSRKQKSSNSPPPPTHTHIHIQTHTHPGDKWRRSHSLPRVGWEGERMNRLLS